MLVVLDASAVVELVLVTAPGVRIRRRLSDPRISMHGPELVDLEVLNVLRRYVNAKLVTMERAMAAVRTPGRSRSPTPSPRAHAAPHLVMALQPHGV